MNILGHTGLLRSEIALAPGAAARSLEAFAAPVGLLALSAILVRFPPRLPELYPVLAFYGPYVALSLALLISLAFKRGRAVSAVLALLIGYAALRVFLTDAPGTLASKAIYGGVCTLVPLNLAAFALAPERGAFSVFGVRRLALLVLQAVAVGAVVAGGYEPIAESLARPALGAAVTSLALLAALVCAVARAGAIEAGIAVSIAAFAYACQSVGTPQAHAWFAVATVLVAAGVVQDAYRMAFHDELTGLPGRRALRERLMALDGPYAVAMLDVDHFKRVNDTWGHDVGDQVLRAVAARLERVGGGGKAYRYGGEEFAIVFPGLRLPNACFHAEALRRSIERYPMRARTRAERRGVAGAGDETVPRLLAITVSIGVAERNDRQAAPEAVCAAADRALYRAKDAGRNRVCR